MTRYANKTALITGGASGISLATARRFLGEGARVALAGPDRAPLDQAAADLGAEDRVLAVRADCTRLTDLDELIRRIDERFGRLDIVFTNSGGGGFKRSYEITEDEFDHMVDVSFKGVFFTIQKALPLIRGGTVVINASSALYRGLHLSPLHSATTAAVRSLAKTLAVDLADHGIRVNSVSPGFIDAAVRPVDTPTVEDVAIADAVAFLASAEASHITGQDLVVDGGLIGATAA
ncbi:SDR family NAD(P)-dependent oxidoreductase [Actinomadura sp. HBU206391]|uniref:SDR family NAD(P)-dependent oxidoreductase n=1 Tax=Actinomadura sp. HBU206391 TaxID=2731692 RepID=UPI0016501CC3|nr:SDR family oxidoreductase [Actinomadura sp. HBU206391]MBC6462444.1 SDR family oxidoreductase [Actinomadura sp. HBU206391]